MSKKLLFVYSVTTDSGNAPCVCDNSENDTKILTLACCKGASFHKLGHVENNRFVHGTPNSHGGLRYHIGDIFHNKKDFDKNNDEIYLLGTYKDKILYFAKITDVVTMEEYFVNNKNKNRKDCIYKSDKNGYRDYYKNTKLPPLIRNSNNALFHPLKTKDNFFNEQLIKDLLGKYVLISDKYVYFGKDVDLSKDFLSEHLTKHRLATFPESISDHKLVLSEENIEKSSMLIKLILDKLKTIDRRYDLTSPITVSAEPNDPLKNEKSKGCNQR